MLWRDHCWIFSGLYFLVYSLYLFNKVVRPHEINDGHAESQVTLYYQQ